MIGAGQFNSFQVQLSLATNALLNGSFTASAGAVVSIMTPADIANFSASPTSFQCSQSTDCFTTGQVFTGDFRAVLPVYQSEENGQMVATPWYLVQQNTNPVAETTITWTSSLVATYIDAYA